MNYATIETEWWGGVWIVCLLGQVPDILSDQLAKIPDVLGVGLYPHGISSSDSAAIHEVSSAPPGLPEVCDVPWWYVLLGEYQLLAVFSVITRCYNMSTKNWGKE